MLLPLLLCAEDIDETLMKCLVSAGKGVRLNQNKRFSLAELYCPDLRLCAVVTVLS